MIDAHRERFGVEPICRVLEVPTSTYYAHKQDQPSARTRRDAQLKAEIERIWKENFQVYGARKLWRQLQREGIGVVRLHRRAADGRAWPAGCGAWQAEADHGG